EGAALGLGGAFSAAADLLALAWIQSRMVFFVAAAYGYDPRHPMRPAELLALQGVYETPAEARAGLDGVGKRLAHALVEHRLAGRSDQRITRRLLSLVGRRVAERTASRVVPLVSSPIAAVQNAAATKELGRRALTYYGGPHPRP
ncbi:MAG: EcsC family protein, partial [Actinomycetota bacterium]|nr:EcsC family protein [Actinomycetota bacterium]